MRVSKPLVLLIDAYDSFSNNIISLLETSLHVSVRTIKIDDPALASDDALHEELRHYAAIVCGPGPGNPELEEDVGIMRRIWRLSDLELIPVLGVCLGFQSLCLEFGGRVKHLRGPQHGIIRQVNHIGESGHIHSTIFDKVGEIKATHYHSLCVDIGQTVIPDDVWESTKWQPTTQCPELLPLAWLEPDLSKTNKSGVEDNNVLVAVQHKTKPFWALQYHPESICTNVESTVIISNWFAYAQDWNRRVRQTPISFDNLIRGQSATRKSLLGQYEQHNIASRRSNRPEDEMQMFGHSSAQRKCYWPSITVPLHITTADVIEAVLDMSKDQIILESSNAHEISSKVRGRFTIIALEVESAPRFEYTTGSHYVYKTEGSKSSPSVVTYDTRDYGGIWPFLANYLNGKKAFGGKEDVPFWGGFLGYSTYELGLETIDVRSKGRSPNHSRPDLCFAWVERSLVIDHEKNLIYIQALGPPSVPGQDELCDTLAGYAAILQKRFWPDDSWHCSDDESSLTLWNIPYGTSDQGIISTLKEASIPLPSSLKLYHRNNFIVAVCHYSHPGNPTILPDNRLQTRLKGLAISGHDISFNSPYMFKKIDETFRKLQLASPIPGKPVTFTASNPEQELPNGTIPTKHKAISITSPNPTAYENKVRQCQQHIRAGDSYELCLTNQLDITTRKNIPWSLYKTLRSAQPSPFASYIHLPSIGTTFLSSSPERFLCWNSKGACELRPMKGTVRKSPACPTLIEAEKLLNVPKEIAENLMIVDLVRHDLHGVCGSGNVEVPRLMVVEEYKSVFQMISVVQGQLPNAAQLTPTSSDSEIEAEGGVDGESMREHREERYTGLDILAASLPPGSMTGAPKKRSCELLQDVEEGKERGLYSGVTGYLDVGGRGDWSVNIRCLFKYGDEDEVLDGNSMETVREKWHVGAGGAVTILSGVKEEREEMETKLLGTLGLFEVDREAKLNLTRDTYTG